MFYLVSVYIYIADWKSHKGHGQLQGVTDVAVCTYVRSRLRPESRQLGLGREGLGERRERVEY